MNCSYYRMMQNPMKSLDNTELIFNFSVLERKTYLHMIKNNKNYDYIISKFYNKFIKSLNYTESKDGLSYKRKRKNIKNIYKSIITVGNLSDNDIIFNDILISRIHAIIIVLSTKIIVIDQWSFNGTRNTYRSSDKECISSLPRFRNNMIFDRNEKFTLQFGPNDSCSFITFNP